MPAPRLIITHPAPMTPEATSVLPAAPVMFMPAIAVPVAVVMLMPLIPLIPLITSPFDMVIDASIDMPLMPVALAVAPDVGSLSHIIVTTWLPDAVGVAEGAVVMPDCARASGATARAIVAAKMLECILVDPRDVVVGELRECIIS